MGINTDIYNALEARVQLAISENTSLQFPEQQENVRARRGNGEQRIRTTNMPAKTEITTLGPGGVSKQQGIFQIDMIGANDEGPLIVREQADLLLDYFKVGLELISGSVSVVIINSWLAPTYSMGNIFIAPIKVEWNSWNYRT